MAGTDDPFSLEGKNPKRVAPAVRRNINVQKIRVRAAFVVLVLQLVIGSFGLQRTGAFALFAVVCLFMTPFSILAIYCDWRLLGWHRERLAECERRIAERAPQNGTSGASSS
ncbi:hypothetical protein Mal4_02520 [Maioricimonas rarisocia]|uniref:MraY-like glycosyltransferase n=1 Tax=Maioricimonas rarisocia TaxID=2528026 RepID=A0A517Z0M1_9PLAN|nr:hypothetical protein [Maioricimonas rarisocia]QDU35969.1 hypothetical protein Mal4_02520 [Maioricimonas rarisocia]